MANNYAWEKVQLARNPERLTAQDYIQAIFPDFFELHGDRYYGDDAAIIGGIATLEDISVTVIGHEKGRTTEDKIKRNFGMAHPEGYRKSLRLMRQAEKFKRPIICFIDTQGAYPGIGAEERGQAEAIAQNLFAMSQLTVPIISVFIGEGGSGGALALAVADKIYMLENAIYSILSPEGFATILWKDVTKAPDAAALMQLSAKDILAHSLIDGLIPEKEKGTAEDNAKLMQELKTLLRTEINTLQQIDATTLVEQRYQKFRQMGI